MRYKSKKSTWRGNRFAFPLPTFASLPASPSRAGLETQALRPGGHTPSKPSTIGSSQKAPAHIRRSLTLVFLVLALSAPGLAEEAHGNFDLATFLGQVLNFVVLFGGLAYLLRRPLNDYLKGRAEQVAARLHQAETMKQEAQQKLEEVRGRLNNLAGEIRALVEQAEKEAERERAAIREEAGKEAERLRKLAREEIEAMFRLSITDLKAYAMDLSVSLAEKKIKEKLTPELHRKLIHRAIDRLRSTNEPSVNS